MYKILQVLQSKSQRGTQSVRSLCPRRNLKLLRVLIPLRGNSIRRVLHSGRQRYRDRFAAVYHRTVDLDARDGFSVARKLVRKVGQTFIASLAIEYGCHDSVMLESVHRPIDPVKDISFGLGTRSTRCRLTVGQVRTTPIPSTPSASSIFYSCQAALSPWYRSRAGSPDGT